MAERALIYLHFVSVIFVFAAELTGQGLHFISSTSPLDKFIPTVPPYAAANPSPYEIAVRRAGSTTSLYFYVQYIIECTHRCLSYGQLQFSLYMVPALITLLAFPLFLSHFQFAMGSFLLAFFLKRCFEVACIHKFSGFDVPLRRALYLLFIRSLSVVYVIYLILINEPILEKPGWSISALTLIGSVSVITVAWFVNAYHHILLAHLRGRSGKYPQGIRSYKIPFGGLFLYLCFPHYVFECLAWLFWAVTMAHWVATFLASFVVFKLVGRYLRMKQWLWQNVQDYPRDRF